jgi:putative ABC transport system substrate-binding protein
VQVFRVGYLISTPLAASPRREAFRQALRDLGYVEGTNLAIEWRSSEGDRERQRAMAAELVSLNVRAIVAGGAGDIRAAREATITIPIIMLNGGDAVGSGLVASLARPGGNVTGLATLRPELSGKRLELLAQVLPGLARVAILLSPDSGDDGQVAREIDRTARALGVQTEYFIIRSPEDLGIAFPAAAQGQADAALVWVAGPILDPYRVEVAELAASSRLPTVYEAAEEVAAGGLMSYGPSQQGEGRQAAGYVDKILKGASPAELPVEQPREFEFVVNLRAARALGLAIPPHVLAQATEVVQ